MEYSLRANHADVQSERTCEVRARTVVQTSVRESETPAFRCGGWGEPQPFFRSLQQLGEHA
jgi:hypothetical protein